MPSQAPMPTTPTGPQSPPGAPRKLKRSYATVWDELADEDVGVFTHPYIFPKFDNELKPNATDDTMTRATSRDPDPVRQRLDFDTEYANQPTNDIRLDGLPPVPPLPPRPGSAQFMEAPLSSRLAWTLESMRKPDETSQRSHILRTPQVVNIHFRVSHKIKKHSLIIFAYVAPQGAHLLRVPYLPLLRWGAWTLHSSSRLSQNFPHLTVLSIWQAEGGCDHWG